MANFLTRFVPKLSEKTADLSDLLKKNVVFDLGRHYQKAFDSVKVAIVDLKALV